MKGPGVTSSHGDTGAEQPAAEVVEVLLGLPASEWYALEAASRRRKLTVAQLVRHSVTGFLGGERDAVFKVTTNEGT